MNINKIMDLIEDKTSKEGTSNGKYWKRFAFKIGDKTFSSFDAEFDKFKTGDYVEVEYEINGNFNNITTMKLAEGTPPVSKPILPQVPTNKVPEVNTSAPEKLTQFQDREKEKNASIVAQVLIKKVTDLVCAGKVEPGKFKANVLVLVDTYKETVKGLLNGS